MSIAKRYIRLIHNRIEFTINYKINAHNLFLEAILEYKVI